MQEFEERTVINASLAIGWQVLTGFPDYGQWNPLLRRIDGKAETGAALKLRVAKSLGADETVALPAKVRICTPHTEIAWGGGVPGLLDVHHYFRFETAPGGFRFIHGERFRGLLLPLLWPVLARRVRQENYAAFNTAFKVRCEGVAARG
jgi:hypothetical protein